MNFYHSPTNKSVWQASFYFVIIIVAVVVIYSRIYFGESFSPAIVASVLAGTSGCLLILALFLPELSLFYGGFRSWFIYRKQFGILGYVFALGYTLVISLQYPQKYLYGFFDYFFSTDILLGCTVMFIFSFTIALSSKWSMSRLGHTGWKKLQKLNFLGYLLLLIRGGILDDKLWQEFFVHLGLVSPRMLLTVIGSFLLVVKYWCGIKLRNTE